MEPLALPLTRLREVLAGKMARHRNDVDVSVVGLANEVSRLRVVGRIEKAFDAGRVRVVGEETLRDIRLLIEVHDEAAVAAFLANGGQQPAEVRLTDAALEVERRNDGGPT
jgi:hypothetical protein